MAERPRLLPEQILTIAEDSFEPSHKFVLFSGGDGSTTMMDWVWKNSPIKLDAAVHINTGIGVEETHEFVRKYCADNNIPLIEKSAPEGEYERLCYEYGVPGPGMHWQAYRYLKDRQVEDLVREFRGEKEKGTALKPVMLITGVRRGDSTRRMGTTRPIKERKGQLWVAPLIDWTTSEFHTYREQHNVPHNEVADVMHMSWECACGAFGSRDELQMLKVFYPKTAALIETGERMARAGGQHAVWGTRPPGIRRRRQPRRDDMDLCANCIGTDNEQRYEDPFGA